MPFKTISLVLVTSVFALSACSQISRERTKIEPAVKTTAAAPAQTLKAEPATKVAVVAEAEAAELETTSLQIGEETFEVSREKTEGAMWMVKVNGWDYACEAADPQGCMMTVSDARLGDITPILPDTE